LTQFSRCFESQPSDLNRTIDIVLSDYIIELTRTV
jgi:hypothetical protein